jgi:hypothetical protein
MRKAQSLKQIKKSIKYVNVFFRLTSKTNN